MARRPPRRSPVARQVTPHPPVTPPRFRGLDGLRALAVGAVLVFHLTPGVLPGGFIGVDVFFVISGFLITSLLLRERDLTGRTDLRSFWTRRARRLLPALATVVLVCGAAASLVGGDLLVGFGRQLLGAATFSSNWLDIAASDSYFDQTSPQLFLTLWSLAVEEQFYLVWPLVVLTLLLVRSVRVRAAVIAALAVGSALAMGLLYQPGGDPTRVYYGTDTHSFGLAAGALLGVVAHQWSTSSLGWSLWSRRFAPLVALPGLLGIGAGSVLLTATDDLTYRGGLVVVALSTALAIAGAIIPGSFIGRALDAPPLRWVGERSYGLYLWHWPVFALVQGSLPGVERTGTGEWILGGLAMVISLAAATLSFHYIETPVRRHGFRATVRSWVELARRSARGAIAVGAAVLLLAGSVAGTTASLAATRESSDARAEIEQGLDAVAEASEALEPSPSAAAAPPPTGDQITAIGDSVMLASAPELQASLPGISIDAAVSRQLSDAESVIAGLDQAGELRPIVLLGLGTNGPIEREELDSIRSSLAPDHELVLVSVQAPRGWTDGVNAELSRFAQQYRDVELANWGEAIAPRLDLLARDQIHPGSRGGQIYADTVAEALQRLAELPPLLRQNEYGLAPLPQ